MLTRRTFFAGFGLPAALTLGLPVQATETLKVDLNPDLGVLHRLLGRWTGSGEGEAGLSTVERSYEPTLRQFLLARNRSTYAPQEKNPKGEIHEDMGLYSFDTAAQTIVFRQFHTEGFVNTYTLVSGLNAGALVFETTAIENIPAGFRARETLTFSGNDALEERFEIAEPGKDFAVYTVNRLSRA